MSDNISNRFKNARRSAGLTQEEVAELLRLEPFVVQQLETGKKVFSIALIEQFCSSIGVSREYMFLGEGRPMDEPTGTHIDSSCFPDKAQHSADSDSDSDFDSLREIA